MKMSVGLLQRILFDETFDIFTADILVTPVFADYLMKARINHDSTFIPKILLRHKQRDLCNVVVLKYNN
jgi:hypothetical protein